MSQVVKPPVMWFKMDKYHRMGNKYIDWINGIVEAMFDIHKVDGIYFNVLFTCGSECKAKKPLNKQQIISELEKIETLVGEVKINYTNL